MHKDSSVCELDLLFRQGHHCLGATAALRCRARPRAGHLRDLGTRVDLPLILRNSSELCGASLRFFLTIPLRKSSRSDRVWGTSIAVGQVLEGMRTRPICTGSTSTTRS
jgi:hypothetical protein